MSNDDSADTGPVTESVEPQSTRCRLTAHAIAWGLCLGLFLFGVHRIEAVFRDFNMPLPRVAVFVIRAAHQVIALVFLILVLLSVDWLVLAALSRWGTIEVSRTWSVAMFVTPMVLIALSVMALSLPLFTSDFGPLSG